MKNELETLMAAAVVVSDTSAVAAQSMLTYGSTWPSELELWMVSWTERAELLTRGFHGGMQRSWQHAPVKVPRHGVSRCASAVFLRSPQPPDNTP